MAFASSSSSNQQVVLCGHSHVEVFKTNNNDSPADHEKDTASVHLGVEEEGPPYVIVVHGTCKVGRSLLIKSLVEHYTKENHALLYTRGNITIISGDERRIQFMECPNNVKGMRDAAKYADAVILLIDAYVGFEMETFEFVNVLRVHGMPKVMGVLTSLDMFENVEEQTKTKESLMNRFCTEICTEIYEGGGLFCLSGLEHGVYPKHHEIRDLASFISGMDFHPLAWRAAEPYLLVDRFEDVTRPERVLMDSRCNRDTVLYGYLRGCDIKRGAKVHIAGVGDFHLFSVTSLVDPCPLLAGPEQKKYREGKEHDESEGFRPGTYLRLEIRDVPFEIVENYDPYDPILVGGISPGKENVGYIQKNTVAMEEERPPYVIVVHGTRKVGKSLLIKSLVEHYTKENFSVYMQGPVTIISGEQRRIQFVECPNDVSGMLDAAKYADAVILLIDTYFGFEMETFEFVNILRVHGMPKVMGVLTSIDLCKSVKKLSRTKEYLMNHFRTEIYEGARLFCLSGLDHGMYLKHEILDLASYISVMEFHPLSWRSAQPYVVVDRFDNRWDRGIALYGYVRGCHIKKRAKVHIAGVGDFLVSDLTSLDDPSPLLASLKRKRSRKRKEQNEYSGLKPGTYIRLDVWDFPPEKVGNIDPYHPILVGGISPGEENVGYMQATLKRNNWQRKLLKSRDPVILSIGWRRYQTRPIYAMEDSSERLRMLNYTPVDKQCLAMFWGPLASPNTGVVAVQYPDDKETYPRATFRILATGDVADFNDAAKILKKCKRSGFPWKISGTTALIKDLFRSDHEVDIFKDAKLWTESGIQGKVKKAARKDGLPGEGIAKCSFKHRIGMRDTIFMRAWKEVEVPRFFNPLGLSDAPEESPKGGLFEYETDRKSPFGRRMVSFIGGEPSLQDLTHARKFELHHCNKEEQKEFKKHPALVISEEEEMSRKRVIRDIMEKHQEKPNKEERSIESRNYSCYRSLYGALIPTYLKFFCGRDALGLAL